MENIHQIIHKSRVLMNRLKLGITIQNNLTQDGFDINGMEFSKTLEVLENRLLSSERKLQDIQEEVAGVKRKVTKVSEELTTITDENASLVRTQKALLNLTDPSKNERSKKAVQLQNKVRTYKSLTGVRFDIDNIPDECLSGYIVISGDKSSKGELVTFEFDKTDSNCSQLLWDKIKNTCTKVVECN